MRPVLIFLALGLISIGAFSYSVQSRLRPPPAVIGRAPVFTAEEVPLGKFESSSLQGNIWLFNLFFTSCPSSCPLMSKALEKLSSKYPKVEFVSLSVDRERDTMPVLSEYKNRYNVAPDRWHVLTAEEVITRDIAEKGFKLGTGDAPALHSATFALVDREMNVRGYFRVTDSDFHEKLESALAALQ